MSRSHATVRPSLRPLPMWGEVQLGVARERQLGAIGLGAPQQLGAASLRLEAAQEGRAVERAVALLDLEVAQPRCIAHGRIELAAALLGAGQHHFLALLEVGLLVGEQVARAGEAQRLDGRLGEVLVGDAVDLDRLAEGIAAADPRHAVQAKDELGIAGIEQERRIAVWGINGGLGEGDGDGGQRGGERYS